MGHGRGDDCTYQRPKPGDRLGVVGRGRKGQATFFVSSDTVATWPTLIALDARRVRDDGPATWEPLDTHLDAPFLASFAATTRFLVANLRGHGQRRSDDGLHRRPRAVAMLKTGANETTMAGSDLIGGGADPGRTGRMLRKPSRWASLVVPALALVREGAQTLAPGPSQRASDWLRPEAFAPKPPRCEIGSPYRYALRIRFAIVAYLRFSPVHRPTYTASVLLSGVAECLFVKC
jgi:hypothetical protein